MFDRNSPSEERSNVTENDHYKRLGFFGLQSSAPVFMLKESIAQKILEILEETDGFDVVKRFFEKRKQAIANYKLSLGDTRDAMTTITDKIQIISNPSPDGGNVSLMLEQELSQLVSDPSLDGRNVSLILHQELLCQLIILIERDDDLLSIYKYLNSEYRRIFLDCEYDPNKTVSMHSIGMENTKIIGAHVARSLLSPCFSQSKR